MKKFFEKIEEAMFDVAVEKQGGDFIYVLNSGKYEMDVNVDVNNSKNVSINGRNKSHLFYKVSDVEVLDENNENKASCFPLIVERIKKAAPDYQDVINYIRDCNMTETERIFGSEEGYLHYRYGN